MSPRLGFKARGCMSMVVGPILWRGTVYFSHFTDQRLYAQLPGAAPQPLTTATDMLYADAVLDRIATAYCACGKIRRRISVIPSIR